MHAEVLPCSIRVPSFVLIAQVVFPLDRGHTQRKMPLITVPTHRLLPSAWVMTLCGRAVTAADDADDEIKSPLTSVDCDDAAAVVVAAARPILANGGCMNVVQSCVTGNANADVERTSGLSSALTDHVSERRRHAVRTNCSLESNRFVSYA